MTVVSEDIRYAAGHAPMHGRLFRDDGGCAASPGVLVFPEGFGISEHTYRSARRFAELGYVALACDLYGNAFFKNGGGPEVVVRHQAIMSKTGALLDIGRSAFDVLCSQPKVDNTRIAAVGYCLGGTIAIELAFCGVQVAAVAALHPSFRGLTLANVGDCRARIHLFIGAEDYAAPPEGRNTFETALKGKGVRWRMTLYGSVKHSFTNPEIDGMGDAVAYDGDADRDSWNIMAAVFREAFAEP